MSTDRKEILKQKMSDARTALTNLLSQLTPEQWQTPVFSEQQTWTVQYIVAHLTDAEQGMSIQVHKIRKGQETLPEGFDLNQWNAGVQERVGPLTIEELLDRMPKVRARTLQGLGSINEDEWELQGRHPSRGLITIEQYYETIAGHDMTHTRDIKQALGL